MGVVLSMQAGWGLSSAGGRTGAAGGGAQSLSSSSLRAAAESSTSMVLAPLRLAPRLAARAVWLAAVAAPQGLTVPSPRTR